jgi:multiple sugar transport system permease protein
VIYALYAYMAYLAVLGIASIMQFDTKRLLRHLKYHVLIAGAFIMIVPFYWMVMTSFKEYAEAQAYPPTWWPKSFLWGNYVIAWNKPEVGFTQYYLVSTYTAAVTTIGTVITSILAAYAFARMNFVGKGLFFYIVLATIMVPGEVLLIPKYLILSSLGWLDTYKALVAPWLASVFSIFLMRQFFMTIPNDLWDAAQIDGAGRWRFLWRVIVPLSKPVLITSAIFAFIGTWNSLLWPLVVTSKAEMRTIMVGLQVFNDESSSDYELLMAASTFCILPVVAMFFLLQRFFIEGIARSGLKS